MTRAEIAAGLLRMLDNGPQTLRELASCFDESPSDVGSVLTWLAGQGVVQSLGGSWRLVPGQVARGYVDVPEPAPEPAARVAQAIPEEPAPLPAADILDIEPTEPADMAKTKVCNTCEERKPLSAYTVNRAIADGHANRCKACDVEYRERRKGGEKPRATKQVRDHREAEAVVAKLEAAIAAEPAPLLHPTPAIEVSNTALEVFPVLGALVLRQTADVQGRTECQALLIPRADLRSLIDTLTRHV